MPELSLDPPVPPPEPEPLVPVDSIPAPTITPGQFDKATWLAFAKAVDDRPASEVIDLPEWTREGDPVLQIVVRGMDGPTRTNYLRKYVSDEGTAEAGTFQGAICALCTYRVTGYTDDDPPKPIVDDEPLFDESDIEWLTSKSAAVLERMVFPAMQLSALTPNARDEAGKS